MTKKKILLIDDEVSLCKFIKLNLEHTGEYEVTVAHSGEEGIEKAHQSTFDLVITDFKMSGMDGPAVLRALKQMTPHIPVVLCSVYHDDAGTVDVDLLNKADGIIEKPLKHEQLYQTIREALAKRRADDTTQPDRAAG